MSALPLSIPISMKKAIVEQLTDTDGAIAICVKKVEHLSKIVLSLPITEQIDKHCNRVDWNGSVSLLYISNLLNKHIKLVFCLSGKARRKIFLNSSGSILPTEEFSIISLW